MTLPILIGGKWRAGTGKVIASRYPADDSVTAEVAAASPADVDAAVEAGAKAARDPAWRDLLPHQRASFLYKISDLIASRAEALAQLQMRDNGKPISETRALVASAAGTFRYFGAVAETTETEITPSRGPYLSMSTYEPRGVIAAITPWNSPIASDAQKLAPALAAGNAVILKPAEVTPLVALELGRICLEAGVPEGLVSVLPGPGSTVGNAIVRHPLVRMVSFTGGTTTGKAIAHAAADKMMPVQLELGGKSPTIVFDDADLDHAVNGVIFGIFSSAGQSCIAGSRLFVDAKIYDTFLDRLIAKTKTLRIGDPPDPNTQIGPQISFAHRKVIEDYVALGRQEGGAVVCGGVRPTGSIYDKGSFYLPTILAGLGNNARICQEEIFGPVLCALKFKDEADLVAQANDSVYGLACGIWTRDYKRAWRIGRAIEAGTIWINTYKLFSIATPFAAFKDSGIGVEKARRGIFNYMQQKSFYWGLNERPMPWAD
ncbi:MAG: aldehyde dehydrogenase [Alphaproteobacteria bacterium]